MLGTVVVIAVDRLVISKGDKEMGLRTALTWTGVWLALGLSFALVVGFAFDTKYATEYLSGFLLEYSLSMDNVFVFIVLFGFFAVPQAAKLRVLTIGILIALGLRLIAILVGGVLIAKAEWVLYIFGAFLIYTGVKMALAKEGGDDVHPDKNLAVRLFRRFFPVSPTMDGGRFFTRIDGRRMATPLFVVLIVVETTDLVFALDSLPAVLAITQDGFVALTSNIFAILGLRSLYFALAGLMDSFRYLKYSLAVVLGFIGVKMILEHPLDTIPLLNVRIDWRGLHLPTAVSLGVIAAALLLGVLASLAASRARPAT